MTTLWADGFEDTVVANLPSAYEYSGAASFVAGRRVGSSAVSLTGGSTQIFKALPPVSTLFMSMAINPSSFTSFTNAPFFRLQEAGGSLVTHVLFTPNAAGHLAFYRFNTGVLLGVSPSPVFAVGAWTWIQVKVVIHDTAGSIEVRDSAGGVIMSLSGIDTRNAGTGVVNRFDMASLSNGVSAAVDDLHIWNATGTICNDWTNDTRIDSIYPDGAGDATQFTPSAGANWQCVDEPSASAADYVDSDTAGHQDLYAATNLTHNPVSVFGVVRTAVASKDDAGARSIKLLSKSGATLNTGTAQALTLGSDIRFADVLEADPATSAAWTKPGLDALQIGFEAV